MKLKRRDRLLFLAEDAGVVALGTLSMQGKKLSILSTNPTAHQTTQPKQFFSFRPITGPITLETSDIPLKQYSKHTHLLKAQIRDSRAALLKRGLGMISLHQMAKGKWRTNSQADPRISSDIYRLEDGRHFQVTETAVSRKQQGQGYIRSEDIEIAPDGSLYKHSHQFAEKN